MLIPLFDRNPHHRFPVLTVLLIVLNIFCFWQSISGGTERYINTVLEYGFVPLRLTEVASGQPVVVQQPIDQQRVLQKTLSTESGPVYRSMFSMMFLHGGLFHLISNLWMLWVFGDNVEDRLGRLVYVFFYLLGGLIAVVSQWAIDPNSTLPVIGASGAVAAVLGAYVVTFPSAKVKTLIFLGIPFLFDLPAVIVLGAWFMLQMIAGVQGLAAPANMQVSVAFWAHIGGFVAGVLLMPLLTVGVEPPGQDWRNESRDQFEF